MESEELKNKRILKFLAKQKQGIGNLGLNSTNEINDIMKSYDGNKFKVNAEENINSTEKFNSNNINLNNKVINTDDSKSVNNFEKKNSAKVDYKKIYQERKNNNKAIKLIEAMKTIILLFLSLGIALKILNVYAINGLLIGLESLCIYFTYFYLSNNTIEKDDSDSYGNQKGAMRYLHIYSDIMKFIKPIQTIISDILLIFICSISILFLKELSFLIDKY